MTTTTPRRDFFKASGAAAAGVFFPNLLLGQDGESPNNKLNIAAIGCGGKGEGDLISAAEGNNVVALCDVDDARAAGSFKRFPKAKRFRDYRELFDKMGKEIDAVTISTPDHAHYPAAMRAMSLGKHVCVQKPLTNTIWEAEELLKASRASGVVTQMGIQGHTNEGIRLLKEWLDADAIGEVNQVVYWTNRPIWPQGAGLAFPSQNVPATLNWDLWQGPVKARDYNAAIAPFAWRGFWDYGCGALGDIGCHAFDAGFWALNLGVPEWVEASTTEFDAVMAPKTSHLTYRFPAKGNRPAITVTWMDGGLTPAYPIEFEEGRTLNPEWGQLFIGEKGKLYASDAYCSSLRLIPETDMQAFSRPPQTLKRSPTPGDPQKEWVHCIKNGGIPGANFEYAVPLTIMVLMGNVAIRAKRRLYWDAETQRVMNDEKANRYVKRDYRPGWEW